MIQLYRGGSPAYTLDSRNPSTLRQVTKAKMERSAMNEDSVTVVVEAISTIAFNFRDYIIVDGRPYFVNILPKPVKMGLRHFEYDIRFEGGLYELGRVAFTLSGLQGHDYIGTLYDWCNLVVNEMNRANLVVKAGDYTARYTGMKSGSYYVWSVVGQQNSVMYSRSMYPAVGSNMLGGDLLPGPEVTQVGGAWTLDFETTESSEDSEERSSVVTVVETEEKALTYDNHTCLAVMQDLVSQWQDWEFAVDVRTADLCNIDQTVKTQAGGKIVVRRRRSVTSDTSQGIYLSGCTTHMNMAFGKKGGISKLACEPPDDSNLPSRIYFYGGSQNLPLNYRNTRLCMTGKSKEKSYLDTGFDDNAVCEAVKVFDDIYPANKPFALETDGVMAVSDETLFVIDMPMDKLFDIFACWKATNDSNSRYGSYSEWLKTYGTGNSSTDLNRYLLYYYQGSLSGMEAGYPKSCYLTTDEEVTITFQTGDLAGHSFKIVNFDRINEDQLFEITLACEGNESMFPNEPIQYFPNGDVMCKAGDQFIIDGILMPAAYVYGDFGNGEIAAETMLDQAAQEYIDALAAKLKVSFEISDDYIIKNNAVFRLYDRVNIIDDDLLPNQSDTYYRIEKVVFDLIEGSYKVDIDNGKGLSMYHKLSDRLRRIVGNGPSVKVVKTSGMIWNDL